MRERKKGSVRETDRDRYIDRVSEKQRKRERESEREREREIERDGGDSELARLD